MSEEYWQQHWILRKRQPEVPALNVLELPVDNEGKVNLQNLKSATTVNVNDFLKMHSSVIARMIGRLACTKVVLEYILHRVVSEKPCLHKGLHSTEHYFRSIY